MDFQRTMVGGISLPRLIIGSNWFLGYSHTSSAADSMIKQKNDNALVLAEILEVYLNAGINAIMAPITGSDYLINAIKIAENKTGQKMIIIDTPGINVDDTEAARKEAERTIKQSKENGATFCFLHHSSAEQLVNKNKRTIDRLPDYLYMIRENGLIPGLSAHMPELIVYADQNEYDVESYVQIYNCAGFLMQVEIENVHRIIWEAKKPVMTIKAMAAGRVSPFVGLSFNWHTIRPCDMVTVGSFTVEEAYEDIEISRAALEHRPPVLTARDSPFVTEILHSK